jgi:pyruvate kinase
MEERSHRTIPLLMRATKIVATLGPASSTPDLIRTLAEAGTNVFRLNASHGTDEQRATLIDGIRAARRDLKRNLAILLDLQGPKIRLGTFAGGGCTLEAGRKFTITTEKIEGNCQRASTSYAEFARDVKPGDPVLLNDGAVALRVLRSDGAAAECEVVRGGPVSDRKGMNLPGVMLSTPSLTKKDMADLQFGLAHGVDMVAMSFNRKSQDVMRLRLFLDERECKLPIVAKIEKPEAVQNLSSILDESDGVMVARGDLGVEMALEKVPQIQKSIIDQARRRAKFVITATQMLESMIENGTPTRAEVSDVANAIYDGTDAVMLSAETSAGKFPVEAVSYMARIAEETDGAIRARGYQQTALADDAGFPEIVANAAYRAARYSKAVAIAVFTSSGFSARVVSHYRPPVPIYAFTPSEVVARQLAAVYGVKPVLAPDVQSTDQMLGQLDSMLLERGWVRPLDSVVFVAGQPVGRPGSTNMFKLHRVGNS